MKGYKAFNKDLTCRGFQYEIGETYEIDDEPIPDKQGFHFCKSIAECYMFYVPLDTTRICEVEGIGKLVEGNGNVCTNKIRIIKEIPLEDIKKIVNTGNCNDGYCNNGNFNAGNFNIGNFNSGDRNLGDFNGGYRNTGNHNVGDFNSGDFNTGNRNAGVFCTEHHPTIKLFDKESSWTYADWVTSKAYDILKSCPETTKVINIDEKKPNPDYEVAAVHYKLIPATKEDKQNWWDNLPDFDKQEIYNLPNFDAKKFHQCTGIRVDMKDNDK